MKCLQKLAKTYSLSHDGPMAPFSPTPPGFTKIETLDGSFTFFSEAFSEACHSTSGAEQETILHYLQGCRIEKKIKQFSPLNILEVGFGLGIGFLKTYEALPKNRPWHFLSVEIDKSLLEWFKEQHQHHEFLKKLQWIGNALVAENENIRLTILLGNARETLSVYLAKNPLHFHAIYQDAFSPRRNPVLWTVEWFKLLKNFSHPEVILSTYSASKSIRKSLMEAGFFIKNGEPFGGKKSSTRADLLGPSDPEIVLELKRSPTPPLCDGNMREFLLK